MKKLKTLPVLILTAALFTGCVTEAPAEIPNETEIHTPKEPGIADLPKTETTAETTVTLETPAPIYRTAGEATYYKPELYDAVGTGMKRPADYSRKCDSLYYCNEEFYTSHDADNPYAMYSLYREDRKSYIDSLKNEKLKTEIKEWIKASREELNAEAPELKSFLEKNYLYASSWDSAYTYTGAVNGYLSIKTVLKYTTGDLDLICCYDCRCAVFDLYTGEKLELSDLFFEGEEFLPELNGEIARTFETPYFWTDYYCSASEMKRPFSGLTTDCINFTATELMFPIKNPYISGNDRDIYTTALSSSAVRYERNMAGLFEDDVEILKKTPSKTTYKPGFTIGNVLIYKLLDKAPDFLSQEKVNRINSYALGLLDDPEVIALVKKRGETEITKDSKFFDGKSYREGVQLSVRLIENYGITEICIADPSVALDADWRISVYIDNETAKPLGARGLVEKVFGKDWEEKCIMTSNFPGIDNVSMYDATVCDDYNPSICFYVEDMDVWFGADIKLKNEKR